VVLGKVIRLGLGFGFGLAVAEALLDELGDGLGETEADFFGLGRTEGFTEAFGDEDAETFTEAFGDEVTRGFAEAFGELVALVDAVGFAEAVTRGLPSDLTVALGFAETVAFADAVGFAGAAPVAPAGYVPEIEISKPRARHAPVSLRFIIGYFQLGKANASRHFHLIQGNLFIFWHFVSVGTAIWAKLEKPHKQGKVKLWQLWASGLT